MKCRACGYEYIEEWERAADAANVWPPFFRIEGAFVLKLKDDKLKSVELKACPKCYTVRIEL